MYGDLLLAVLYGCVFYCSVCLCLCSTTDSRGPRRAFELLKLFSALCRLYSRVFLKGVSMCELCSRVDGIVK